MEAATLAEELEVPDSESSEPESELVVPEESVGEVASAELVDVPYPKSIVSEAIESEVDREAGLAA